MKATQGLVNLLEFVSLHPNLSVATESTVLISFYEPSPPRMTSVEAYQRQYVLGKNESACVAQVIDRLHDLKIAQSILCPVE